MVTTHETLRLHNSPEALAEYQAKAGLRADEEKFVAEFFPAPPARILDLGVGNGRTTVPLHERGYDVVGIEYCSELVAFANQLYPSVKIEQGDARSLSFAENTFDAAIFSWNGIDYMNPLSERFQVLRETLRVVRPGGIFLVSSHNALGCIGRFFRPPLLTKRAIRFWLDQLGVPGQVWNGYYRWRDDALGLPLFYSARPSVQKQQLIACGWEVLAIRSVEHPAEAASTVRDVHIQYVCRKPS
jgi:SAM-dependent methyltransferase